MALEKEKKQQVIKTYKKHEKDTGSPEVQVALLTERINSLTEHFKKNKKDANSRQGLLKMVNMRRRLLGYVKKVDFNRYQKLIEQLKLRK
ncbi:MAG: 30S ribosomal protein S15 [bacterium]